MRSRLTLLFALSFLAATSAAAQSLPHGVTLQALNATRHADGAWVITSDITNHRDNAIGALSVVYALYDGRGQEVDRVTTQRDTPLHPGDTWQARATTTTDFARISAKEITETPSRP